MRLQSDYLTTVNQFTSQIQHYEEEGKHYVMQCRQWWNNRVSLYIKVFGMLHLLQFPEKKEKKEGENEDAEKKEDVEQKGKASSSSTRSSSSTDLTPEDENSLLRAQSIPPPTSTPSLKAILLTHQ